jgi:antitoxin (DNA-binding transcriptional repressor) of toxin-antitoxin stability system
MKSATVGQLRNDFASISKWIEAGESVGITRKGIPFAILSPIPKKAPRRRPVPRPVDLMARLRKAFPNGPVQGDIQEIIDYDRGDT